MNNSGFMARFVNVPHDVPTDNSYWELFLNGESLAKATVRDFCKTNTKLSYATIATPSFGRKIIYQARRFIIFG